VSLLAAITYGVSAIAYGIGALMVVGLGCQDNVALRVCHFAALEVTVRRCASIGNSSGSVPFRSLNDTVSNRQSASGLLEYYYQCSQDKERRVRLTSPASEPRTSHGSGPPAYEVPIMATAPKPRNSSGSRIAFL
jgi:hypothetical protein